MAVLLNKFEDMSYAEIAEVMGRRGARSSRCWPAPGTSSASSSSPTSPGDRNTVPTVGPRRNHQRGLHLQGQPVLWLRKLAALGGSLVDDCSSPRVPGLRLARDRPPFCPDCRDELLEAAGPACPRCDARGEWRPAGRGSWRLRRVPRAFARVRPGDGAGPYEGPSADLSAPQARAERLAGPLAGGPAGRGSGEALRSFAEAPAEGVVVVPVPLHWRRRCRRGYNQAEGWRLAGLATWRLRPGPAAPAGGADPRRWRAGPTPSGPRLMRRRVPGPAAPRRLRGGSVCSCRRHPDHRRHLRARRPGRLKRAGASSGRRRSVVGRARGESRE